MWTKLDDYRSFVIYHKVLSKTSARYRAENGKVGTKVCDSPESVKAEVDEYLDEGNEEEKKS